MGAELTVLIVLLAISVVINIAFVLFTFLKTNKNPPKSQYKKVENASPERVQKPLAVPIVVPEKEEPKKIPEVPDKNLKNVSKINELRSVENELRSEHGVIREPQQRSDRQKLQEPVGRSEFVICMNQVVQFVNEYFDESHKYPVIPENDISAQRLLKTAPEKPEECSEIMKDLKEVVIPNICHTQHPRYHAKFSGKSLADIVGSTISSALGYDVNSSPIIDTIEQILCRWLRLAMAIPPMKRDSDSVKAQEPSGAVFYTSRDVYVAIIRHCVEKRENSYDPPLSDEEKRRRRADFVIYCSDDGHVALEEACTATRVKLRKVYTFEKDSCGMTAQNLEKQIAKDVEKGLTPLVVVANYGSANVAANDEIWDLVKVSKSKGIWLHLDATYGGCEWLDQNRRNNIHALLVDCHSVHVAFHSLFPYSGRISIVWSGDRLELEGAKIHYGEHPVRLWILIRLYGIRSIREAVSRKIMLGNAFSERISHHPEFFDVHHANEHGVTVFQYNNKKENNARKENVNKMTSMFYNYLVTASVLKFSLFMFHEKVLIKAVVNFERCNLSMMEESISTLLNSVEEFEETFKKKKATLIETPKIEYCEMIGGSPNETTDKTQADEKK